MIRILYIVTRSEVGGAQVHVLNLLKGLQGRAELHLAVGKDADVFLVEAARGLGIEVHRIRHLVHPISPIRDTLAFGEIIALLRVYGQPFWVIPGIERPCMF